MIGRASIRNKCLRLLRVLQWTKLGLPAGGPISPFQSWFQHRTWPIFFFFFYGSFILCLSTHSLLLCFYCPGKWEQFLPRLLSFYLLQDKTNFCNCILLPQASKFLFWQKEITVNIDVMFWFYSMSFVSSDSVLFPLYFASFFIIF